jgi:hypothetical protein
MAQQLARKSTRRELRTDTTPVSGGRIRPEGPTLIPQCPLSGGIVVLRDDVVERALVVVTHPDDDNSWPVRRSPPGPRLHCCPYCVLSTHWGLRWVRSSGTPGSHLRIRRAQQETAATLLDVSDVWFLVPERLHRAELCTAQRHHGLAKGCHQQLVADPPWTAYPGAHMKSYCPTATTSWPWPAGSGSPTSGRPIGNRRGRGPTGRWRPGRP